MNKIYEQTACELISSQPYESEILAKDYTSDIDSGYKDAAHIQNGLLCICLFTDFAQWETN